CNADHALVFLLGCPSLKNCPGGLAKGMRANSTKNGLQPVNRITAREDSQKAPYISSSAVSHLSLNPNSERWSSSDADEPNALPAADARFLCHPGWLFLHCAHPAIGALCL